MQFSDEICLKSENSEENTTRKEAELNALLSIIVSKISFLKCKYN